MYAALWVRLRCRGDGCQKVPETKPGIGSVGLGFEVCRVSGLAGFRGLGTFFLEACEVQAVQVSKFLDSKRWPDMGLGFRV